DLPLADADSIAHAEVSTRVVAQTPQISLQLQGPLTGVTGQPLQYAGTLFADPLPDLNSRYFVEVRISRDGNAADPTDLELAEIFWGGGWQAPDPSTIPWFVDGSDLVYLFPQPVMPNGFPIDEP